jgi:hypothetical protein
MVKESNNVLSGIEELKNIPICDLFYKVVLDIVGPLSKIETGNKYVLIDIDHYSKWCEGKLVKEHGRCKLGWLKSSKNLGSKSPYFNIKMEKKVKNQC